MEVTAGPVSALTSAEAGSPSARLWLAPSSLPFGLSRHFTTPLKAPTLLPSPLFSAENLSSSPQRKRERRAQTAEHPCSPFPRPASPDASPAAYLCASAPRDLTTSVLPAQSLLSALLILPFPTKALLNELPGLLAHTFPVDRNYKGASRS